jgi:effector-binding domain-containing protein
MRKTFWILLSLLMASLSYYLFVKSYEYEVNFKVRTLPGDIIETIRIWDQSLDSTEIISVDTLNNLRQVINRKGMNYIYNWSFTSFNDSLTKVKIEISQPGYRLINKILIPFANQIIEDDAKEIANSFYEILKMHLEIIGETKLDSAFCVCTSLETNQTEKANGMMRDYPLLATFVEVNNLIADGAPRVIVREWNHRMGLLKFDFCFPIQQKDSLPSNSLIHYKKFKKTSVLKAEYYGNYIRSDRAWYELINYADLNGYKVDRSPIEYFLNNPNLGADEKKWKAEVFLPIVN